MVGLDAGPWQSTIQKLAARYPVTRVVENSSTWMTIRSESGTRGIIPAHITQGWYAQGSSRHLTLSWDKPFPKPICPAPASQATSWDSATVPSPSVRGSFFTFSIWVVQPSSLVETYCTEQAFSRIAEAFSLLKQISFWGTQDLNSYNKSEHDDKHLYLCTCEIICKVSYHETTTRICYPDFRHSRNEYILHWSRVSTPVHRNWSG